MPIDATQLESGVAVVAVTGRLALGPEIERLDTVVSDLLSKDHKRFVLDISGLDYADSSGIGALVASLTKVKKSGGDLRMAGANPRLQRIFKMTGVDQIMPMYATVSEAAAG